MEFCVLISDQRIREMIEIKFLGRGGQGVVVASELLARACFEEGLYPQCFSIFGGERRGAPVAAFVRVGREKIYLKCDIERPDHLVLFDEAFLSEKGGVELIKPGGVLLLNGAENCPPEVLKRSKVAVIHAQEISRKYKLGAIVNTTILGAYIRLTQMISLDTLLKVIQENVPSAVDKNVGAAREAFESVSFVN
jgi:2-oxoacid:acceptor oxidoreductase gamma subunit (pyruvate/2-ketoisovalerate family)